MNYGRQGKHTRAATTGQYAAAAAVLLLLLNTQQRTRWTLAKTKRGQEGGHSEKQNCVCVCVCVLRSEQCVQCCALLLMTVRKLKLLFLWGRGSRGSTDQVSFAQTLVGNLVMVPINWQPLAGRPQPSISWPSSTHTHNLSDAAETIRISIYGHNKTINTMHRLIWRSLETANRAVNRQNYWESTKQTGPLNLLWKPLLPK